MSDDDYITEEDSDIHSRLSGMCSYPSSCRHVTVREYEEVEATSAFPIPNYSMIEKSSDVQECTDLTMKRWRIKTQRPFMHLGCLQPLPVDSEARGFPPHPDPKAPPYSWDRYVLSIVVFVIICHVCTLIGLYLIHVQGMH